MVHERNKVSFFWVLIVFLACLSMAYADTAIAKTVIQYNKEVVVNKQQRDLDFPVVRYWPAGKGENAVWVNPRQPVSPIPIGMAGTRIHTPEYKVHFRTNQPQSRMIHPMRIYRSVAKLRLFSWN